MQKCPNVLLCSMRNQEDQTGDHVLSRRSSPSFLRTVFVVSSSGPARGCGAAAGKSRHHVLKFPFFHNFKDLLSESFEAFREAEV